MMRRVLDFRIFMFPFHVVYAWLFRSFRIDSETTMVKNLQEEGVESIIVVKRSWIYALFLSWIPVLIAVMVALNIYILFVSYQEETVLRMTMIGIMIFNTVFYFIAGFLFLVHFRGMRMSSTVWSDLSLLIRELETSDRYFIRFFNQSIFVQLVIIGIIIFDLYRLIFFGDRDMFYAVLDIINLVSIWLLLKYHRKKIIDMEMDYSIAVPGKIYFANQTGVLSSMYSIESNKIKSVRANYPSKLASFFQYGNIDILTEGDAQSMMGTMSMYFITEPDVVVGEIQKLLIPIRLDVERQQMMPKDTTNILAPSGKTIEYHGKSDTATAKDTIVSEALVVEEAPVVSGGQPQHIHVNITTATPPPAATTHSPNIQVSVKEKVAEVTEE